MESLDNIGLWLAVTPPEWVDRWVLWFVVVETRLIASLPSSGNRVVL
ncbi:MAG: hypothetical protein KME43_20775 [Myxacorys chilensis ATA2-1-KO14]|nr:hypothetical protein [Myxacorys chilensis ATA2-1-KO14]